MTAAGFSAWSREGVSSKALENQDRTQRMREQQRWDRGLPVFMTACRSSHQLHARVVNWIATRHDEERAGIGRPGTVASRASHSQERPRGSHTAGEARVLEPAEVTRPVS